MPGYIRNVQLMAVTLSYLCLVNFPEGATKELKRPNVLFLVADDMRPQLTSYMGDDFPSPIHPKMHTPHLDDLARNSMLLMKAYCQQAVCSPSRTSLLTGRRPDTTHVYDLVTYFRHVGGNFTTIPQYFKQHGYRSVGMGKIFHPGIASHRDDPISWSEPYYHAPNLRYWNNVGVSWRAVKPKERLRKPLPDEQLANNAIVKLQELAKNPEEPFFLAIGFQKPHLPWVFPEEFLEYYPLKDVRVPDNEYAPVNMPGVAWSSYGELRNYRDIALLQANGAINSTLPRRVVRRLRRAYYSALSYTDRLIGMVVDEVRRLGMFDQTIISFWGDHGWQLGEHGEWSKHTNFELATHAPMMIRVPGLTERGVIIDQPTEFVDLFPTLVEAAGLPELPLCPEKSHLVPSCHEGMSLVPLMKNPREPWKRAAFSQFPRPGDYMGYSLRTPRYRYTEWVKFIGQPFYRPVWRNQAGVELYDHSIDPEENVNRAKERNYTSIRTELSRTLQAGWRSVMPRQRPQTQDIHGKQKTLNTKKLFHGWWKK